MAAQTVDPRERDLDALAIDTLRTLAIDAVEKANSGHPGTPMAMAPVGYTLWSRFLRYDPDTPDWPNRDRFVLSAGHASMLLYGLLHLTGVREIDAEGRPTGQPAVSLEDIRQFRQLSSKTPGHPEYRMTTGVETTTGPLGQGCGNSVGMALAERWLAARFNRDDAKLFDHDVYVLCGDGDMMEGVSGEAASLAGHYKLSNLCWIYDNNTISIEGHTSLAFTEDVAARFRAYGWKTLHVDDANDTAALSRAIETFKASDDAPTLIVVNSVIGYGAPTKANTEKATASRWSRRSQGRQAVVRLARGRAVPGPRRRRRARPRRRRRSAAGRCARPGTQPSPATASAIRTWPRPSSACVRASCRTAGTRTCRPSRRTPRGSPRATPAARR
ncbi:hypothetical protein ACRAWD_18270 [Caulobacter segnis]